MRQATYQAEGQGGPAEVAVFYFGPGQGGDNESNITRWVGQFEDVPADGVTRTEEVVGGMKSTSVRVERVTFNASMPGSSTGPQKDWGMSAAIVESPAGPYFFKMTGPAATVASHKDNFARLLASVTQK